MESMNKAIWIIVYCQSDNINQTNWAAEMLQTGSFLYRIAKISALLNEVHFLSLD